MIVGVPKEIKCDENRVAITPANVADFTKAGHTVLIEKSAGGGSGFEDKEYQRAGATLLKKHEEVFSRSNMIVKVKEPLPPEYGLFRSDQVLFTYLHLAPAPELTAALCKSGVLGIAYETIELGDGTLPLLIPMSEVAGRMSIQIGAQFLEKHYGGRGVILGGVPGVEPANVVIIGGGVVGTNAAKVAVGMGADVTILDNSAHRLRELEDIFNGRVKTVMSNEYNIVEAVKKADLLVGAVLLPGAKAPRLVTEEMVRRMRRRSVIVDVAIDQGGCVETIDRVMTLSEPTFLVHDVVHYAVANIPAAVPRSSTLALTNVTIPYALEIANKGYERAIKENGALAKGVNLFHGKLTIRAVADSLGMEYTPLNDLIG